jgi:hypothetical protein
MTSGIGPGKPIPIPGSRALKGAEWLAENAYIAPGFHRLLTAGGLTLGLWGGRKFMDIITARNATTGEEVSSSQAPQLVRPLHGILRYNPYSDEAADRWKFVADRLTPIAVGALGAYFGGKLYFNGRLPSGEPFFHAGAAVLGEIKAKKFSSEITDAGLRMVHADATRKWAASIFGEGSAMGQHLFGALWPFNNGMIAVSFQQGAGRNISFPFLPKVNRFFGNHGASSRYLYGAMRDTAKWMEANIMSGAAATTWAHDGVLLRRARDGLQKFRKPTAAQEANLVNAFKQLIDDGYAHVARFKAQHPNASEAEASEHLYQFLSGKTNPTRGLLGASYDHLLHSLGHDLRDIKFARDPWSFFSRMVGARPKEMALLTEHANYLNNEFNYALDPAQWANQQLKRDPWKVAAAYGGGAAAIGGTLASAAAIGTKLHRKSEHTHKPHIFTAPGDDTQEPTSPAPATNHNNLLDWVNGAPLNIAHWVSRTVITPPSMHRFMSAAYLSIVLYGGMKFSNILTGRNLTKLSSGKFINNAMGELVSESIVARENVWAPLRPLHGLMAYTPGSAAIADRWRQAVHYIMPVAVGMFGTYAGSHLYFADRIKSLQHPESLEDYADKISLEQSKFYAGATAVTSIFNTGSGIHLLPIFSYSSNLHNRYLLGNGQQVAMPGIGKWWSGNAGTTPWGVKNTLLQLTHYLSYNDSARPKELPTLVHSLIGKLYPNLNEMDLLDKKQIIIDRIHDIRDSYLVEGVVPPSKQAALNSAMSQLFAGQGFEELLEEAGLNPAEANLAANGASGAIANFFGSRAPVHRLSEEYKAKFAARHATNDNAKPADFLRGLLDTPKTARPTANDNAKAKSFAERTKPGTRAYPVMG